jgi:hypothetical protein
MEAVRIKRALANAKFHLRIMWRGFCKIGYGAAVAGLIAMAIYEFISVSKVTGWISVFKFLVACALLVEGLGQIYFTGGNKKSESGKRERR